MLEDPGIDPGTSHMQSERSTTCALPPDMLIPHMLHLPPELIPQTFLKNSVFEIQFQNCFQH